MADMFIKFDGVNGESTDDTHKQECELFSFSFGASNAANITSATTGAAAAGRVSIQDFSISKRIDDASSTIFNKMAVGDHFATATVTIRKPSGQAPLEFLIYKFSECYITSYSISGSDGGGNPIESVSFASKKVTFQYTSQEESGGSGGTTSTGWDLTANKEQAYG